MVTILHRPGTLRAASPSQVMFTNDVGFRMVFLYDRSWSDFDLFLKRYSKPGEDPYVHLGEVKKAEFARTKTWFYSICLLLLLLSALAMRAAPDDEAFAWGVVPVFLLLNIACYYYVLLLMFVVIWGKRTVSTTSTAYLSALFGIQGVGYVVNDLTKGFWLQTYHTMSLLILLYLLFITASELRSTRQGSESPEPVESKPREPVERRRKRRRH